MEETVRGMGRFFFFYDDSIYLLLLGSFWKICLPILKWLNIKFHFLCNFQVCFCSMEVCISRESFSNIHSFLRSLVILEVNKCLIFSLDFYVLVLNFFPKKFVDFTTVILRLSFEIILKLTNVSYFLCWICCFWGTMSFCSHFYVLSSDFIFVEFWNNMC